MFSCCRFFPYGRSKDAEVYCTCISQLLPVMIEDRAVDR